MDKNRKNTKSAFTFAELMISLVVIAVLSAILYPTIAQFTPNSNKPLFKSAYKTLNEVLTEIINDQPNGQLGTYIESGANEGTWNVGINSARWLCVRFCEKANVIMPLKADGTPETTCNGACTNTQNNKPADLITTSNGMRWRFMRYDKGFHDRVRRDGRAGNASTCLTYSDNGNLSGTCNGNDVYGVFGIIVDVNASNNNLSLEGSPIFDSNEDDRYRFETNCTFTNHDNNPGCGTFIYRNTTGANGIYTTIPNYTGGNNIKAVYNQTNLKNQDTFEIYIDRRGKIVSMSPAAWANLEDNEATGN